MTKDEKSVLPGSLRDHQDAVRAEAEKVSTKIDEAFGKLAKKMRERADKAKAKLGGARKPEKRAALQRRFELYADAATHLEERFPQRNGD
jgi:predicted  nucleic acid-binding Zn-ribbon protein